MYCYYDLDDAIIYLYSILPYVDTAGAACLDFFQGGELGMRKVKESSKTKTALTKTKLKAMAVKGKGSIGTRCRADPLAKAFATL